jgi:predicted RNA methylase
MNLCSQVFPDECCHRENGRVSESKLESYVDYLLFGKIVLDVGTGSGILAIWAAQAGAKKVYAVEATKMAEHARRLVAGNGVENIVEVIEGSIEDIDIPEKGIM